MNQDPHSNPDKLCLHHLIQISGACVNKASQKIIDILGTVMHCRLQQSCSSKAMKIGLAKHFRNASFEMLHNSTLEL